MARIKTKHLCVCTNEWARLEDPCQLAASTRLEDQRTRNSLVGGAPQWCLRKVCQESVQSEGTRGSGMDLEHVGVWIRFQHEQ